VNEYNVKMKESFPPPLEQNDDNGEPMNDDNAPAVMVAPNPDLAARPASEVKAFFSTLGTKSAASISGAPAGAIMYAYAAISMGFNAHDTVVPNVFMSLTSAADLSGIRAAKVLSLLTEGNSARATEYATETDPVADHLPAFRQEPENKTLLDKFSALGITLNHVAQIPPPRPPLPSASYVSRVLEPVLSSLLKHVANCSLTAPLQTHINEPPRGAVSVTVLDIVKRVYPALSTVLASNDTPVLQTEFRPIIAHLCYKAGNLWLRDDTFIKSTRVNSLGRAILEPRYYTPPFVHTKQNFNCFTRTTLLSEYLQHSVPHVILPANDERRRAQIIDMLEILDGTRTFEETSLRGDQRCGAATSLTYRRERQPQYVCDHINGNNASKKSANNPFRATVGRNNVSSCEKSFPTNHHWTPGIMVLTCACSARKCLHANFMDQFESPLSPFEILTNRFPRGCPPYVVYDNACHLLMYCMQREPSWFWACRFAVDRFHEPNHVQSCSSSIHTSSYKSGPLYTANTQAVEQLNKVLRARLETRLRFMNLDHAVVFLLIFLKFFNES
jgi:hypothetical protein